MKKVILRLQALVRLFAEECGKGNAAFVKMKETGQQAFYRKEIAFAREYAGLVVKALAVRNSMIVIVHR